MQRIAARLFEPVDAASSVAFRVLFGLVMAASVARFWAKGWIDELYVQPEYMFHYWGFAWVQPLGAYGMHAVFAALFVSALLIAAGVGYRVAAAVFFVGFSYVELLDVTNYLNHYYFVSIVAGLLVVMPLHRGQATVPRWVPWTLRLQLGIVYTFAGLAKLQPDWLFAAQPLRVWLQARADVPWVGPLLGQDWVAYAMSWAGALFDLSVFWCLLLQHTRRFAYAAVVGFHVATWSLFNIGVFPWVMIGATTIFFGYAWPRRIVPPRCFGSRAWCAPSSTARSALVGLLAVHFTLQLTLPLRHVLYRGDTQWHEQGFRFAWRVMLREKTGMAEFRVAEPHTGRRWRVSPSDELTPQQVKMMAVQPDLLLQYAHHLADRFESSGFGPVEVRADAWAALNGRPSQRLIDPEVDLAAIEDSLRPYAFVMPLRDGG